MHSELRSVCDLHKVDRRRQELITEIARLPNHIAEIQQKLECHREKLKADQVALEENRKSHRQLEGKITTHEQKISRLQEQLSEARTNEQFRAFQREIKFEQEEIRKIEDRILEGMEEAESLEQLVAASEKSLELESQAVEKEVVAARARVSKDEEELAAANTQRQGLVVSISPEVLATYERVQKLRAGETVAEASVDRCLACNVRLRPQFSQMLRFGETVLTCESCGRILYYGPSDLGAHLEEPACATNLTSNNHP